MPKYIVTEIVEYEIEAADEETAVQLIIDAADRDKFVVAVTDRFATPVEA